MAPELLGLSAARFLPSREAYRKHMGKHFAVMTLVEVKNLYEAGAMVEIEGSAVL